MARGARGSLPARVGRGARAHGRLPSRREQRARGALRAAICRPAEPRLTATVTVGVVGTQGRRLAHRLRLVEPDGQAHGVSGYPLPHRRSEAWVEGRAEHRARRRRPRRSERRRPIDDWKVFSGPRPRADAARRASAPSTTQAGARQAYETLDQDVRGGSSTALAARDRRRDAEASLRRPEPRPPVARSGGDVQRRARRRRTAPAPPTARGRSPTTSPVAERRRASSRRPVPAERRGRRSRSANGATVASQDTGASPEALVYDPPDAGRGDVRGQDLRLRRRRGLGGGSARTPARSRSTPSAPRRGLPYPPKWRVFPANGELG